MPDHGHLRTPQAQTLSDGMKKRSLDQIKQTGAGYPCHVVSVQSSGIVTVAFDITGKTFPQIKMPVMGPEYIRYPIQVNDKGWAVPATARLGGESGLGTGTPNQNFIPGNLGALTFMWIGSSNWSLTDDPQAVVSYGPNGVIIRTEGKTATITVNNTGITIDAPGLPVNISAHSLTMTQV